MFFGPFHAFFSIAVSSTGKHAFCLKLAWNESRESVNSHFSLTKMTKTKNLDLCTLDIEIFFCPFHMQLCRPFSPCTGNKHAFCLKLALNAMKAESVIIQF